MPSVSNCNLLGQLQEVHHLLELSKLVFQQDNMHYAYSFRETHLMAELEDTERSYKIKTANGS